MSMSIFTLEFIHSKYYILYHIAIISHWFLGQLLGLQKGVKVQHTSILKIKKSRNTMPDTGRKTILKQVLKGDLKVA